MKILIIADPEGCYLEAQLYMGLCEEFDAKSIVEFPRKESYHGKSHSFHNMYENGRICGTSPFNFMAAQENRAWSEDEVCDNLSNFDIVALSQPRILNTDIMRKIIKRVGRDKIKNLVIIDDSDESKIREDIINEFSPSVYFKRELIANIIHPKCKIKPCPFASALPLMPIAEKSIDLIEFSGRNYFDGPPISRVGQYKNFGMKTKQDFDDALGKEFPNFIGGFIEYEYYLSITNRAKIAICLGGCGWDSLRYWEITSFPDTLMLMNRTPQIIPNQFIDGIHCLQFSTYEELVDLIRKYLNDDEARIKIARAGNEHLRAYHTVQHRAKYFAEEALK